jgi:hypothetical protein
MMSRYWEAEIRSQVSPRPPFSPFPRLPVIRGVVNAEKNCFVD